LGEKQILATEVGRKTQLQRRVKNSPVPSGAHRENQSPQQLAWKARRAKYPEFLQLTGLKPGILMVSRLGWDRAPRALCCSWRECRQTTHVHTAWE